MMRHGSRRRPALLGRDCRCGRYFLTTNPRVRWCSNQCRQRLGAKPLQARQRRAREVLAVGSHTEDQWQDLLKSHGYRCYYCQRELLEGKATRDHKIPLCRGGSDYISNIVPACRSCNSKKHTLTASEYLEKIAISKPVVEADEPRFCAKPSEVACETTT